MKHYVFGSALILTVLPLSGAQAQIARTYVSASGMDSGTCPANAPCRSFQYAIDQTPVGGVLACQTNGSFGPAGITTSLTINCLGTNASSGAVDSNIGSFFSIAIGASDRVVLRGIDIQANTNANSISFSGAGTLVLDQMKVGAGTSGNGAAALRFRPNGAGKLVVTDSVFTAAGTTTGGGIVIRPQAGGTAQVTLNRVVASGNAFGIAIDGAESTGGINATITDSVTASNANDGIVATSSVSTAPVGVAVVNSYTLNNGFGIRSIGSNVTVRVKNSEIIGNSTGLSGGGALLSGGGNTVQANASNGAFTGSYAQQ